MTPPLGRWMERHLDEAGNVVTVALDARPAAGNLVGAKKAAPDWTSETAEEAGRGAAKHSG